MKTQGFLRLLISLLISTHAMADAESPFVNLYKYLQLIQYDSCDEFRSQDRLKIAIIENSFPEFTVEAMQALPDDVVILNGQHYHPTSEQHGLYVAQLLYLMTTKSGYCPENSPKIYLIPAPTYSPFKEAITAAIQEDVDIILSTGVWTHLGFGDGKGFLNAEVNRAIDNGIMWLNAAGNYQGRVFQNKIKRGEDGWLKFEVVKQHPTDGRNYIESQDYIEVECPSQVNGKRNTQCDGVIHLQWSAFNEDESSGTDKNLDFIIISDIEDSLGKATKPMGSTRIQTTDKNLVAQARESQEYNYTLYPYEEVKFPIVEYVRGEKVEHPLRPGKYKVRIKASSNNFDADDEFRLILDLGPLKLNSFSAYANTILAPADNKRVITVGAGDSDDLGFSSENTRIGKPEVKTLSSLFREKEDGETENKEFRGSSIAVTIYAALTSLVKAKYMSADLDSLNKKIDARFFVAKEQACRFEVTEPDNHLLMRALEDFPSLRPYPHKDGVRLLSSQRPATLFGLEEMEDHFIGINPLGKPTQVANNDYYNFIYRKGIVIDEVKNYNVCE